MPTVRCVLFCLLLRWARLTGCSEVCSFHPKWLFSVECLQKKSVRTWFRVVKISDKKRDVNFHIKETCACVTASVPVVSKWLKKLTFPTALFFRMFNDRKLTGTGHGFVKAYSNNWLSQLGAVYRYRRIFYSVFNGFTSSLCTSTGMILISNFHPALSKK